MTTKYAVTSSPQTAPILSGPNRVERIAELLKKAADLNEKYKLPELSEQIEAWNGYANLGPSNGHSTAPVAPKTVTSLSRVGRPQPAPVVAEVQVIPEPEPEPVEEELEADDLDMGEDLEAEAIAAAVTASMETSSKPESSNRAKELVNRLKASMVKA